MRRRMHNSALNTDCGNHDPPQGQQGRRLAHNRHYDAFDRCRLWATSRHRLDLAISRTRPICVGRDESSLSHVERGNVDTLTANGVHDDL
jgi:hypothetical protein